MRKTLLMLLVLLTMAGLPAPIYSSPAGASGFIPASFAQVAKMVKPAVVNINTVQVIKNPWKDQEGQMREFFGNDFFQRFFGVPEGDLKQNSLGSGVIVDKAGYVLTNNHVVEKASEIKVKLADGREFKAKIVGKDSKTDIAVIKIQKGSDFPVAAMGDSDVLEVGDWVVAVGSPFGLEQTVTHGIISAKGRVIGQGPYDDFLQTDAAINPGNSGGPLVNLKGEVVGINSAIETNTGSYAGVSFAIPINIAKNIYSQLVKNGKVIRGWLGVTIQPLTEELAKNFKFSSKDGVLVSGVQEGGPADKSGIKNGDVIVEFNGTKVTNPRELQNAVAAFPVDQEAEIKYFRNGESETAKVKVSEREKGEAAYRGTSEEPEGNTENKLGFGVEEITDQIRANYKIKAKEGVIVDAVDPSSPAAEAGLAQGDVIEEINNLKVKDLQSFNKIAGSLKAGANVVMLVERQGMTQYLTFKEAEAEKEK